MSNNKNRSNGIPTKSLTADIKVKEKKVVEESKDVTPESGETIDTLETVGTFVEETEAVVEEAHVEEEEDTAVSDVEDEIPVKLPFDPDEFEAMQTNNTPIMEKNDITSNIEKREMIKVDNSDTFYIILGHTNKEIILSRINAVTADVKENEDGELYIGPFFSRDEVNRVKKALSDNRLKGKLKYM